MNPNIELEDSLFWIKGVEDVLKIKHPKKPIYKEQNIIIGEGIEDEASMQEPEPNTEQGI